MLCEQIEATDNVCLMMFNVALAAEQDFLVQFYARVFKKRALHTKRHTGYMFLCFYFLSAIRFCFYNCCSKYRVLAIRQCAGRFSTLITPKIYTPTKKTGTGENKTKQKLLIAHVK